MATHDASGNPRLLHLDSIRGVAALSVALFHCLWHIVLIHSAGPVERGVGGFLSILDLGKFGVVVFFAISGFVIPYSASPRSRRPIVSFLVSRFFRLYPAYWVSVFAGAALLWHWVIPPALLGANLTMFQRFFGIPDVLGVYWTLQIELLFYAICAFLLWRGILRSPRVAATGLAISLLLALALAYYRHATGMKAPVAIPMSLAVMFWGGIVREGIGTRSKAATFATAILLAALLPVCILGYDTPDDLLGGPRYIFTYATGIVLFRIWSAHPGWHNRVLGHLGKISFSIYLLHPIAMGLDRWFPGWNPWLTTAAVLASTIAGAELVYRFVELPCIELGRRVRRRLEGPAAAN